MRRNGEIQEKFGGRMIEVADGLDVREKEKKNQR